MIANMNNFFDGFVESDVNDKKEVIYKMVDILDGEQLSQTIDFLTEPYFEKNLKHYLIDSYLPPIESPEFLFLVQLKKYNGNIVKKIARDAGISNYYFEKFVSKYNLKEIVKGMYIFPKKEVDASFLFQSQYSKSVVSHEMALYILGLTDIIPKKIIMSMPLNYNFLQLNSHQSPYVQMEDGYYNRNKALVFTYIDCDPMYVVKNNYIDSSQISQDKTYLGNPIRVTSAERTIVDILKNSSETEEEIKVEALRRYFTMQNNRTKIRRIAKEQNILKELDRYLYKLHLE